MKYLDMFCFGIARASDGAPVLAVLVTFIFYVFFDFFMALTERVIWGERFVHFIDPVVCLFWMAIAARVVWFCGETRG